jgi:hypothetical protein
MMTKWVRGYGWEAGVLDRKPECKKYWTEYSGFASLKHDGYYMYHLYIQKLLFFPTMYFYVSDNYQNKSWRFP